MNAPRFLLPAALTLAFACTSACGGKPPAAPGGKEPAAAGKPADLKAMLAAADTKRGKILFLQCRACHSLVQENEPGKIGPTLFGAIGRQAGTVPGFIYSEALAKSGLIWTPENIDLWIERPSDFLPGNKMVFIGIPDPQDRANVIAYLREQVSPAK
jgi:cytochrome c